MGVWVLDEMVGFVNEIPGSEKMPVVLEPVDYPRCGGTQIAKHGKSAAGKRRYKWCNLNCVRRSFIRVIFIKAIY